MQVDAATFPCFEDPAESDDRTTDAMRRQLRSWYRWIDNALPGGVNIEIGCPDPRYKLPRIVARGQELAAQLLQKEIAKREAEAAARIPPQMISAEHVVWLKMNGST